MNNISNLKLKASVLILGIFAVVATTTFISCDPTIDSLSYDLPDANSKPDATPPTASFSASVTDNFLIYNFGNASSNATMYSWDFGDGGTATSVDAVHEFPDEGTYTVMLTASDALGQSDTYSMDVVVVEPEVPDVPDPVLINAIFDKLPKLNASDCACAAWDNDDLGEQGESSSGNGSDVLKLDNAEPDHAYQEFEVQPNADYQIQLAASFKSLVSGTYPSVLEVRVLAGSGYNDGYTPVYYSASDEFPSSGYGYTSLSQVEEASNNLFITEVSNPSDDSYMTYTFNFNAGANTSVALFIRGIGNADPPEDPADFAKYGFCSGEEEIRVDFVSVTAIN